MQRLQGPTGARVTHLSTARKGQGFNFPRSQDLPPVFSFLSGRRVLARTQHMLRSGKVKFKVQTQRMRSASFRGEETGHRREKN